MALGIDRLPANAVVRGRTASRQVDATLGPADHNRDEVASRLYTELSNSIREQASSSSRCAITLSGGLDSRAILGCAMAAKVPDIRTFTFGSPDCADVVYARELARRCGVPHTVVPISGDYLERWLEYGVFVTGGMMNCIHFHILSLADTLGAEADVVLDGLGGDALTGGHLKHRMINARSADDAMRLLFNQRATGFRSLSELRELFEPGFFPEDIGEPIDWLRPLFAEHKNDPPWYACHAFDLRERQRRFIQFGPHLLRPFVDVQTPFYYPPLYDYLAGIRDPGVLMNQRAYLEFHRKHLADLAAVPDATRGVPIAWPDSVRFAKRVFDYGVRRLPGAFRRPLSGRSPSPTNYNEWFRTLLADLVKDRLLDAGSPLVGIVRRPRMESLVAGHMSGERDDAVKIGLLLTLDTWLRMLNK